MFYISPNKELASDKTSQDSRKDNMILRQQQVSKESHSSSTLRQGGDVLLKASHHSPNEKLLLTLEDPFQIWAPRGSHAQLCQKQLIVSSSAFPKYLPLASVTVFRAFIKMISLPICFFSTMPDTYGSYFWEQ